jgi:hypothetical protein
VPNYKDSMTTYVLKGTIRDSQKKPVGGVKVQAMESDQKWFEDRNDDLLDSKWVDDDGTFQISFDTQQFQDGGWLEGKPDIYLIVRNSQGQIVYTTEVRRGVDLSDIENLTFNITIESLEKHSAKPLPPDPYATNNERVIAAFGRLGDVSQFQPEDTIRILRLLTSSINGWSLYTREYMWSKIGYDGPQVPRYPWREQSHSHKLSWEKNAND